MIPFVLLMVDVTGFEIIELGDCEAVQEIKVKLDRNRELKVRDYLEIKILFKEIQKENLY